MVVPVVVQEVTEPVDSVLVEMEILHQHLQYRVMTVVMALLPHQIQVVQGVVVLEW
tara:strand:- start:35 stop:202 length:168 start_codon:yes stop_codon:yes gene_type:complete